MSLLYRLNTNLTARAGCCFGKGILLQNKLNLFFQQKIKILLIFSYLLEKSKINIGFIILLN